MENYVHIICCRRILGAVGFKVFEVLQHFLVHLFNSMWIWMGALLHRLLGELRFFLGISPLNSNVLCCKTSLLLVRNILHGGDFLLVRELSGINSWLNRCYVVQISKGLIGVNV